MEHGTQGQATEAQKQVGGQDSVRSWCGKACTLIRAKTGVVKVWAGALVAVVVPMPCQINSVLKEQVVEGFLEVMRNRPVTVIARSKCGVYVDRPAQENASAFWTVESRDDRQV